MTQETEIQSLFYGGGDLPTDNTTIEHVALIAANLECKDNEFVTSKRDLKEGFPAKFQVTAFLLVKGGGEYIWATTEDRVNNPCGHIGEHLIKVLLAKGVEVVRIHSGDDPFRSITKQVNKGRLYIISNTILKKLRETEAGQRFLDNVTLVAKCPENVELPRGRIVSFLRGLFRR